MHNSSLSFSRPATSNHVLLKAALLLPLITGCGGSDEIVGQDVTIPSTSTVPYKAELTPGDRNNAFAPFSADERKKLSPLQVKWLNLINESNAEIDKILQSSANPGVAAAKVNQYYAKQAKQFRALKDEIERTGIDNWRFEITEAGLGFAPGHVFTPWVENNGRYISVNSNAYGFFLSIGDGQTFSNLGFRDGESGDFKLEIGDLSEASQDAFDQKPGTPAYVSIPPGSFFIHRYGYGTGLEQEDPCLRPKEVDAQPDIFPFARDVIVQSIDPGLIIQEEFSNLKSPLRCTMEQRFYIVDPKAILISSEKSDNRRFPEIYQQVLENCRNRMKAANEKLDVDGGSKWRRGAVESGGASSVKVSEG
ncbi:MAG: hypothetical protein O3A29_06475 [Planctomycetota bacterium]|nr:hypothetical protein [Planctomycetota bacterium]